MYYTTYTIIISEIILFIFFNYIFIAVYTILKFTKIWCFTSYKYIELSYPKPIMFSMPTLKT